MGETYSFALEKKVDTLCRIPNKDDVRKIKMNAGMVHYYTHSNRYEHLLNIKGVYLDGRINVFWRKRRKDIPKCMIEFKKLEELVISKYDLDKLKNLDLPRLKRLSVINSSIREIENLEKLPSLESLTVTHSEVEKISGLDTLKNLEYLDLSSNKIKKIEGLDNLRELKELDLGYNQIEKMEGLDSLKNVFAISLNSNKIKKIEGIDALKNLEVMHLVRNKIRKFSGFSKNKKLKKIDLKHNYITELSEITPLIRGMVEISFNPEYQNYNPKFCPKTTAFNIETEACDIGNGFVVVTRNPIIKYYPLKSLLPEDWMEEWNSSAW